MDEKDKIKHAKINYSKKEFCDQFNSPDITEFFRHPGRYTSESNEGFDFYRFWGFSDKLVKNPWNELYYSIPPEVGKLYSGLIQAFGEACGRDRRTQPTDKGTSTYSLDRYYTYLNQLEKIIETDLEPYQSGLIQSHFSYSQTYAFRELLPILLERIAMLLAVVFDYGSELHHDAKINLQPGTVKKYTEELNDKILPTLGHLKLSAIKPHILISFYNSMLKDGARKDGKPGGYSSGTIRKTHNVLSSILRSAVEWEVIEQNPCDKVKPPSAPDTSENIKFFTPEQAIRFLDYLEQPYSCKITAHKRIDDTGKEYSVGDYSIQKEFPLQIRVLLELAVYSGCRKAELVALTWSDIDFSSDTISISKAVTVVDGKPIIKAPKTKSSFRKISIPHSLILKLKKLQVSQAEYRLRVGAYWKGAEWIFTQDDGTMMNYSTPYHTLQSIIKRYNRDHPQEQALPLIPFHGLRHTAASLLIASNQDIKTVSARMGHSQTSTTLNIYTHNLSAGDKKASDALEAMLKKDA